jgi:hypothetical protein
VPGSGRATPPGTTSPWSSPGTRSRRSRTWQGRSFNLSDLSDGTSAALGLLQDTLDAQPRDWSRSPVAVEI